MNQETVPATKYLRIANPQTPEEWARVGTLLRLALAAAQRLRAEEAVLERETNLKRSSKYAGD